MRRKSLIGAAFTTAAALLLAACGGSSAVSEGSDSAAAESSTQATDAPEGSESAPPSSEPAAGTWYPTGVSVWGERGFETAATQAEYSPVGKATQPWNVCVSFPHLKDSYWLAANYGVVQQSMEQGVNMTLVEAGGYENLDKQIQQIENCAQSNDAIVIGAISFEGLNRTIDKLVADGKVVIDFINGVSSANTTAQSLVSYREIAAQTANYLLAQTAGQEVTVAWFPGPKGAGFAEEANKGFTETLAGSNVTVVNTQWGDTGKEAQSKLIEDALAANPDINFIAGNAVTAEAAIPILRDRGLTDSIGVLSYYMTPGTYAGIEQGSVLASAADPAVLTSRIAIDQAVRALEGQAYDVHVAPDLEVVDGALLPTWDRTTTLAPNDWKPEFSVQGQ